MNLVSIHCFDPLLRAISAFLISAPNGNYWICIFTPVLRISLASCYYKVNALLTSITFNGKYQIFASKNYGPH